VFACIYIPDFPVEAIVRVEPLLRECAVAILDGNPPLMRVLAVNERARRIGMEIAMTKLQAAIFTEEEAPPGTKSPQMETRHIAFSQDLPKPRRSLAILRRRSPEQEKSAHSALLDIAFGFSPRVEDSAEDRVLLDLSGLDRLHGSATNMARGLAAQLCAAGLEGNVAIAGNPDSAMHAACGFTGTTVISSGEEAKRLGALPLQVLLDSFDLPRPKRVNSEAKRKRQHMREQMLDTLERWGVRDFRTLALLPEHALASRLGEAGARMQRLARGTEARNLTLCEPELRFEEALELESSVETLEPLSFLLNRLLEQLCARLEARAMAVHELHLRLQLERRVADEETITSQELLTSAVSDNGVHDNSCERRLKLPVAMRDAKVFLKLLQLDLSAHPPGAPVLKLWITAKPAPPRSAQRGLFLPLSPEAEKLEITLARIISIVGEHRAGSVRLRDTHRPDAFAMERFTTEEQGCEGSSATLTASEGRDASYALRVFRPALPLAVRTLEGRPIFVYPKKQEDHSAMQGAVLWSAGPWRCSGEWWAEPSEDGNGKGTAPWDREEWDIALQNEGDRSVGLYRIYHDVGRGQWFGHAMYD
jgi:protein ImuB